VCVARERERKNVRMKKRKKELGKKESRK
jgi:hypothetical protein